MFCVARFSVGLGALGGAFRIALGFPGFENDGGTGIADYGEGIYASWIQPSRRLIVGL